jgi:hypothetical protein
MHSSFTEYTYFYHNITLYVLLFFVDPVDRQANQSCFIIKIYLLLHISVLFVIHDIRL